MKLSFSSRNKGMTLIEVLVSIAIVSVIALIVAKFQGDIFTYNKFFESSFSNADKSQKLLRPMTQEIRSASQSSIGAYAIDSAAAYDFSFYSDIDNDSLKERVRYYISGTDLIKQVTKPTGSPLTYLPAQTITTTFMTGVRNLAESTPMFTYYDSTYIGEETGVVVPSSDTITDIRMIKISIRLDDNTSRPPGPIEVTSQVSIRNLKQQQ